jgi:hypothetical protein
MRPGAGWPASDPKTPAGAQVTQANEVATQAHTEPHMSSTHVTAQPASSAHGRTPPAQVPLETESTD